MSRSKLFLDKINLILLLSIVCAKLLFPQEPDSRYLEQLVQHVEQYCSDNRKDYNYTYDPHKGKCGFWMPFEVTQNWNFFSETQKEKLRKFLSIPGMQKDTIIGHFKIFYDTSGSDAPALLDNYSHRIPNSARAYVDSVGKYFNYSWDYLIRVLGYEPPPFQEGNSYYSIVIQELGATYGMTYWDPSDIIGDFTPPRYTSYIVIENDFLDFYSEGMEGLKVTSAHELHHAFQIGSYGYRNGELYIYEITSTWMEDVIFDDVNDYYSYLRDPYSPRKGHFMLPDISFTSSDGVVTYSRAIWGKFIEKRFSRNVMRKTWEYIRTEHTLQAINKALTEAGSSFRNAFIEWSLWNLNTGQNCDTLKYYSEGRNYPTIIKRTPVEYSHVHRSFIDSIEAVSSVYHPICILNSPSDNCSSSQQMMAIITNLNTETSFSRIRHEFEFAMTNNGDNSYTKLVNGIYVKLIVPDPENWVYRDTIPSIVSDVTIYPNPFYPKGMKPLYFRLPYSNQTEVKLSIFNSNMEQIISKQASVIIPTFDPKIQWDGHDKNGNIVSSGVYFYVIEAGAKTYIGKFAVIRE